MSRSSPPRGTVVPSAPEGDSGKPPPSDLFDIFRLAAWAHWPLSDALEPSATFFAAVTLALYSLFELDINRSTDCTHGCHQMRYLERRV
jgi:hypothetical protein